MEPIDDVILLDRQRIKAMIDKDVGALDMLLADDLIYTHTNAKKDNKQSLISALLSGALSYRQIETRITDTRALGDTAVLAGEADMIVSVYGARSAFEVRFTNIYVKRDDRWQMAVWQSTKVLG